MNIQLIGSKTDELSLFKSDEEVEQMEFSVSTAFTDETPESFLIIFELKLKADDGHILSIRHLSQFKADKNIEEKDRESKFFSINAPAIAYPFLRAFVANFLLNAGFEPAILPTINFVKLFEQTESE